jgi:hypothetical protein
MITSHAYIDAAGISGVSPAAGFGKLGFAAARNPHEPALSWSKGHVNGGSKKKERASS